MTYAFNHKEELCGNGLGVRSKEKSTSLYSSSSPMCPYIARLECDPVRYDYCTKAPNRM